MASGVESARTAGRCCGGGGWRRSRYAEAVADLYYMSEKFGVALHLMAVTDAPLRQRVRDAYVSSARLAHTVGGGPPNAQPSAELMERTEALAERVTQDGTYDTSFDVMSDDEVEAVAEEIYSINLAIEIEIRGLSRR